MRVRREIAIRDPTSIKIDRFTKSLMDRYKGDADTYDTLLRRAFKR